MIQYLLFYLLFTNSIMFLFMNHPLSMGFILMIQTLLISLFSGIYSFSFWFSYSLFLIFMGGMLILFMYMTSLASNETFNFSMNFKILTFFYSMLFLSIFMFLILDSNFLMMEMKKMNEDKNSFMFMQSLLDTNKLMLNKMYNFPMNMITILLIFYLFITLIASVKITNIFSGPLRMK